MVCIYFSLSFLNWRLSFSLPSRLFSSSAYYSGKFSITPFSIVFLRIYNFCLSSGSSFSYGWREMRVAYGRSIDFPPNWFFILWSNDLHWVAVFVFTNFAISWKYLSGFQLFQEWIFSGNLFISCKFFNQNCLTSSSSHLLYDLFFLLFLLLMFSSTFRVLFSFYIWKMS